MFSAHLRRQLRLAPHSLRFAPLRPTSSIHTAPSPTSRRKDPKPPLKPAFFELSFSPSPDLELDARARLLTARLDEVPVLPTFVDGVKVQTPPPKSSKVLSKKEALEAKTKPRKEENGQEVNKEEENGLEDDEQSEVDQDPIATWTLYKNSPPPNEKVSKKKWKEMTPEERKEAQAKSRRIALEKKEAKKEAKRLRAELKAEQKRLKRERNVLKSQMAQERSRLKKEAAKNKLSETALIRVLANIRQGSTREPVPLLAARSSTPPPPQPEPVQPVSPESLLPEDLRKEIQAVNKLFELPCLRYVGAPAVYEMAVAGNQELRVELSFPENYPLEPPTPRAGMDSNSEWVRRVVRRVLEDFADGTPCLGRLARALVQDPELIGYFPEVPWNTQLEEEPEPVPEKEPPRHWFPVTDELEAHMKVLRGGTPSYPPAFPEFERKEGYDAAFISQKRARALQVEDEANKVEGNERLEFLGDSILNALITCSMVKHYQVNEGGMTRLHSVLRSNILFAVFARAYGLPEKMHETDGVLTDKQQADIFEAVVGGLYKDGGQEKGGWVVMEDWFSELISPWIEWTLNTRFNEGTREAFVTFNRIPLSDAMRRPLAPLSVRSTRSPFKENQRTNSSNPIKPTNPTKPTKPTKPVKPVKPVKPTKLSNPSIRR